MHPQEYRCSAAWTARGEAAGFMSRRLGRKKYVKVHTTGRFDQRRHQSDGVDVLRVIGMLGCVGGRERCQIAGLG